MSGGCDRERSDEEREIDRLRAEVRKAQKKILGLEAGMSQMRLLAGLPLPEEVVAVVTAARALVAAADACDREAQGHPSSRSSAPLSRYISAMARLREALAKMVPEEGSERR